MIAQVNEIVDDVSDLPRVDIPGSWVDFVVQADKPFFIEPLFTRDPRLIKPVHVLMAMMAIRGIYERHQVQSLNHGIGFNTAAIELILPTYGEQLGLKGKICRHWTLNPHPTLIPAIESGWVESVHRSAASWAWNAMSRRAPMSSSPARDGSMRSNRMLCQLAGQYAVDLFIGSTLQIDGDGQLVDRHARPAVRLRRRAEHGPRPARPSPLDAPPGSACCRPTARSSAAASSSCRWSRPSRPAASRRSSNRSTRCRSAEGLRHAPGAGDDLRRRRDPCLTEEGIAYLYKAQSLEQRQAMIAAVAGVTPIGLRQRPGHDAALRRDGLVALPEDLGVDRNQATRSLLAAKSMADLVEWSGGLYEPPARFRSW